jgi:hypothetical protein
MQAPGCGQAIRSPTQGNVAQWHGATWTGCLAHEHHERCDGSENHQHGQSTQVHISLRINPAQQCKTGNGKALSVELARPFLEILANRHKQTVYHPQSARCPTRPRRVSALEARQHSASMATRRPFRPSFDIVPHHGISLEYRRPDRPQFGAHIERYLGTLVRRIPGLPGTAHSKPIERGKYRSEARATMTMAELERWTALAQVPGTESSRSALSCSQVNDVNCFSYSFYVRCAQRARHGNQHLQPCETLGASCAGARSSRRNGARAGGVGINHERRRSD